MQLAPPHPFAMLCPLQVCGRVHCLADAVVINWKLLMIKNLPASSCSVLAKKLQHGEAVIDFKTSAFAGRITYESDSTNIIISNPARAIFFRRRHEVFLSPRQPRTFLFRDVHDLS